MTAAWWMLEAVSHACAFCQDPNDKNSVYIEMTMFMSLLPLLSMAAGGLWLWRRANAAATA